MAQPRYCCRGCRFGRKPFPFDAHPAAQRRVVGAVCSSAGSAEAPTSAGGSLQVSKVPGAHHHYPRVQSLSRADANAYSTRVRVRVPGVWKRSQSALPNGSVSFKLRGSSQTPKHELPPAPAAGTACAAPRRAGVPSCTRALPCHISADVPLACPSLS